jgi:hypothetical protein
VPLWPRSTSSKMVAANGLHTSHAACTGGNILWQGFHLVSCILAQRPWRAHGLTEGVLRGRRLTGHVPLRRSKAWTRRGLPPCSTPSTTMASISTEGRTTQSPRSGSATDPLGRRSQRYGNPPVDECNVAAPRVQGNGRWPRNLPRRCSLGPVGLPNAPNRIPLSAREVGTVAVRFRLPSSPVAFCSGARLSVRRIRSRAQGRPSGTKRCTSGR